MLCLTHFGILTGQCNSGLRLKTKWVIVSKVCFFRPPSDNFFKCEITNLKFCSRSDLLSFLVLALQ
jgi:hypothetical protein